jgi:hypothetical protein
MNLEQVLSNRLIKIQITRTGTVTIVEPIVLPMPETGAVRPERVAAKHTSFIELTNRLRVEMTTAQAAFAMVEKVNRNALFHLIFVFHREARSSSLEHFQMMGGLGNPLFEVLRECLSRILPMPLNLGTADTAHILDRGALY